jgi:hypothetical protein
MQLNHKGTALRKRQNVYAISRTRCWKVGIRNGRAIDRLPAQRHDSVLGNEAAPVRCTRPGDQEEDDCREILQSPG